MLSHQIQNLVDYPTLQLFVNGSHSSFSETKTTFFTIKCCKFQITVIIRNRIWICMFNLDGIASHIELYSGKQHTKIKSSLIQFQGVSLYQNIDTLFAKAICGRVEFYRTAKGSSFPLGMGESGDSSSFTFRWMAFMCRISLPCVTNPLPQSSQWWLLVPKSFFGFIIQCALFSLSIRFRWKLKPRPRLG